MIEFLIPFVVAGHSRPEDGVASARLCAAIHVLFATKKKGVDAWDKPGHVTANFAARGSANAASRAWQAGLALFEAGCWRLARWRRHEYRE
jgi:hypothetical protein